MLIVSMSRMQSLAIFCILICLQGCCRLNKPFGLETQSPVPIDESYISLASKGTLISVFGSAVVLKDGWAVTNRHVVEGVGNLQGCMSDGHCFPVQGSILSQRLDLAAFRIPKGFGRPVATGARVQKGDTVYSAGTTCGESILDGIVVAPSFKFYHVDIILPEASTKDAQGRSVTNGFAYRGPFVKGFSGGPVVNSKGRLVGINQGKLIQVIAENGDLRISPDQTYGLAYHIADVLAEMKCLLP
jgi:S1-C subfamily serine protease